MFLWVQYSLNIVQKKEDYDDSREYFRVVLCNEKKELLIFTELVLWISQLFHFAKLFARALDSSIS